MSLGSWAAAPVSAPVAQAFEAACRSELDALKPGNVHRYAAGHGMVVEQFEASARAAAPAIARTGARVGARVLAAVEASWAAAGCNTNLGIVLLCAPLARAADSLPAHLADPLARSRALSDAVAATLATLDVEDARLAFRAIALANPGGLGRSAQHDVREAPLLDLRSAMHLAADRDRIARQYTHAYADIFDIALPALRRRLDAGAPQAQAVGDLFLELLALWPDSHVMRKFGDTVAQTVSKQAHALREHLAATGGGTAAQAQLLQWDAALKTQGINPGTTADLTVATVFVHLLGARPQT